ncbi:MAG: hypothetical protein QW828_07540 [Candidatus Bathyarchaeia archaeon]
MIRVERYIQFVSFKREFLFFQLLNRQIKQTKLTACRGVNRGQASVAAHSEKHANTALNIYLISALGEPEFSFTTFREAYLRLIEIQFIRSVTEL